MTELRNVSFTFPGGVQALSNVSEVFPEGRVTAVLGPNGAGKTTLFRCILGFCPKYTGSILYNGTDLRTLSPAALAKKVAYIPQQGARHSGLTLRDFVTLGSVRTLSLTGVPGPRQREAASGAIRLLSLEALENRPVRTLSGGERQLALIARALCQQSDVLLMDEPDASLDPAHAGRVLSAAAMLAEQGHTVILSTHRPEYAARYATDVLLLKAGTVLSSGETAGIMTGDSLSRLYDTEMRVSHVGGELFIR
ncbi:MAG: ABC transporter ATP-binding protein [Clostridia bacterium]|nr:ABC transporter ATP-binding protein [Clostridia bacterium]